jgi:hypothetical protein
MQEVIVLWLLHLITAAAPPERLAAAPQFPGWEETAEQKTARYTSIATDLYSVVWADDFEPLFPGVEGRARTAALVLAVAYHESGFSHDVDKGPCYQPKNSKILRCDGGMAVCLLQVHMGYWGKTKEGWTKEQMFQDRKKCFTVGIRKMRQSMSTCRTNSDQHKLAAYASGRCTHGLKGSRELWALYQRFWSRVPFPKEKPAQG